MLWAERRPLLEGVTFEDAAASEFPGHDAWRHRNGHGHNNGHDASESSALAVRAAILAANGYEEGARNDARLLNAKPLLPEERALIAPLLQ